MSKNVGKIDQILRAALGLVLLFLAFGSNAAMFETGALKYGAALVGLVMLGTAGMRFCPLYTIFGIRTCRQ